jgi:hypothetical protein
MCDTISMYNQFVTVFHEWSGILQFFFVIIIAGFGTSVVLKLLDIISTFVATVPIMI